MIERWKDIPGYEGWYQASNLGRIRSVDREIEYSDGRVMRHKSRIRKPQPHKLYNTVRLSVEGTAKTIDVGTLVASAWLGKRPTDMVVARISPNKADTSILNLKYKTKLDVAAKGEAVSGSKLTEADVLLIRRVYMAGASSIAIAKNGECKGTLYNV